jgi:hypothetical protein
MMRSWPDRGVTCVGARVAALQAGYQRDDYRRRITGTKSSLQTYGNVGYLIKAAPRRRGRGLAPGAG